MKKKVTFKFTLGEKVRDRVTGMEGILDQVRLFINGCVQYSVQAPWNEKEQKMGENWWIDEAQLELVDRGLNKKPIKMDKTVGPMTRVQK